MLEVVERGGAISRRLLAFARRDTLTIEPVDAEWTLRAVEFLPHNRNYA